MSEKQKHTPGPWKILNEEQVTDAKGNQIAWVDSENPVQDAKRIVECVNAMEGIENPAEFIQSILLENEILKVKLLAAVKSEIPGKLKPTGYSARIENQEKCFGVDFGSGKDESVEIKVGFKDGLISEEAIQTERIRCRFIETFGYSPRQNSNWDDELLKEIKNLKKK